LFGLRAGGFIGSIFVAFCGALMLLLTVRLLFGSSKN